MHEPLESQKLLTFYLIEQFRSLPSLIHVSESLTTHQNLCFSSYIRHAKNPKTCIDL